MVKSTDLGLIPSTHGSSQLSNSGSRGSNEILCPPGAPGTQVCTIHKQIKHTHKNRHWMSDCRDCDLKIPQTEFSNHTAVCGRVVQLWHIKKEDCLDLGPERLITSQSGALVALLQDLGSIPITYMAAHNYVTPVPGDLIPLKHTYVMQTKQCT